MRQRLDARGRRLPAGPAPPRSWTARPPSAPRREAAALPSPLASWRLNQALLPGSLAPHPGSLIDIVLKRLALDWDVHRVYNQHYLYLLPPHIKPALIRYVGLFSGRGGVTAADVRNILVGPADACEYGEHRAHAVDGITWLDLSGSTGRSIRLKELGDILFPAVEVPEPTETLECWEAGDDAAGHAAPTPLGALLPGLTHLSLALDPSDPGEAPWKQLLSLSSKLSGLTHLSLAFWPVPCLAPRSRLCTVGTPQGRSIAAGGTSYYSHSLDDDWSEALLVLRMLSTNLYKLEFLDLCGCADWLEALVRQDGHDYVDWAGSWGKVTTLRLLSGGASAEGTASTAGRGAASAAEMAERVERHIVAQRAGRGRFVTVERDGAVL